MNMQYQDGKITIDNHEIALLTMITGKSPNPTTDILAFIYWNEAMKHWAKELLLSYEVDPDEELFHSEKEIRASVEFASMVCDKFNDRALQLAREAGKAVDFY